MGNVSAYCNTEGYFVFKNCNMCKESFLVGI